VNGQKQGGNVASYFCTPGDGVLDAIAGPVDAATVLREARWVVDTRKTAMLDAHNNYNRYKMYWRLAHAERLQNEDNFGGVDWQHVPFYPATESALTNFLNQANAAQQMNQQGKIHLLLATYPLAPLDQAYRVIYQKIVGERISDQPVDEVGQNATAPRWSGGSVAKQARANDVCVPNAAANLLARGWAGSGSSVQNTGLPSLNSNLPSSPGDRHAQAVQQARNNLSVTEVASGSVLNVLLGDIEKMQERGETAQTVPLGEDVVGRINLAPVDRGPSNFGILRGDGKVTWPLAWNSDPLARQSQAGRESFESTLHKAIEETRNGHSAAALVASLRRDLDKLGGALKDNVATIEPQDYIAAKHQLEDLSNAVDGLARPDAGRFLNGSLTLNPAKIKTVADLVGFMADKSLRFGPARSGDEWAYLSLQRSLAGYDRASEAPLVAGRF
jgi:hypothetical protein